MCEIVVLDPSRTANKAIHQLAATLQEEQGDGFGILSIQPDGDTFSFETYRSTTPHWMTFAKFIERTEADTWRYVLHGRYQTAGDVNRQNTHPLPVDCSECTAEWVVHNGSVKQHTQIRGGLMSAGHTFETDVDSEVIAHKISSLPEKDLGDLSYREFGMRGTLNYIVAFEDGIFARLTHKYGVTDDFVVSCSKRKNKEPMTGEDYDKSPRWFRLTPDDGEVSIEKASKNYTAASSQTASTTSANGTRYDAYQDWEDDPTRPDQQAADGPLITETYQDLIPKVDGVVAYEVAPGIVKVVDKARKEHFFVRERDEPQAYEWYTGNEATRDTINENQETFQQFFDENGDAIPPEELNSHESTALAEHLLEHEDPEIRQTAAELVNRAIEKEVPTEDEVPLDIGKKPAGNSIEEWQTAYRELRETYTSTDEAVETLLRLNEFDIRHVAKNAKATEPVAITPAGNN